MDQEQSWTVVPHSCSGQPWERESMSLSFPGQSFKGCLLYSLLGRRWDVGVRGMQTIYKREGGFLRSTWHLCSSQLSPRSSLGPRRDRLSKYHITLITLEGLRASLEFSEQRGMTRSSSARAATFHQVCFPDANFPGS